VSSVSALGSYPNNKATDEEALWQHNKNTSGYSVSKYYAENEVWRASEEGLDVVIVNPATIIGFGDWNDSSSTILKKIYDGLPFYPSGANGFVGVNDVVSSMILLMEGDIKNERYVLVGENLKFIELFTLIANSFNKKPPHLFVAKKWAKLVLSLEVIKAFITGKDQVLTKESVDTAYRLKEYTSQKIISQLNFQFENINHTISETCGLYLECQK
jgi:nucleoside-diphosphate-sugar epimerase